MEKPTTYAELVVWFNCRKLQQYYAISPDDIDIVYSQLIKGWNLEGTQTGLTLIDPKYNGEKIVLDDNAIENDIAYATDIGGKIILNATLLDKYAKGVTIIAGVFSLVYPPSYSSSSGYSSYSGGSSSNNNN
ncbi:MAG: hypothetical protein IJS47_04915, partial [Clostridia bacterium]|nr:hypothetical protein [Clostridia bacterium]